MITDEMINSVHEYKFLYGYDKYGKKCDKKDYVLNTPSTDITGSSYWLNRSVTLPMGKIAVKTCHGFIEYLSVYPENNPSACLFLIGFLRMDLQGNINSLAPIGYNFVWETEIIDSFDIANDPIDCWHKEYIRPQPIWWMFIQPGVFVITSYNTT